MTEQPLLDEMWQVYREEGIDDWLTVVTDAAGRLHRLSESPALAYQGPGDLTVQLSAYAAAQVDTLLRAAWQMEGQAAAVFDLLLDRLPSEPDSGRYVTPAPLVKVMAAAVRVEETSSIADFTCGSGRLLAALPSSAHYTGVELSPQWLWLTAVNLALRDIPAQMTKLRQGDARRWLSSPSDSLPFEVLVMDPPRREEGSRKDSEWVEHDVVWRALKALPASGQAAVIVSSDLLRMPNTHFSDVARELVARQRLAAVITLPRTLTAPTSGTRAALNLLAVGPEGAHQFTWMLGPMGGTERVIARLLKNSGLTHPARGEGPSFHPVPDLGLLLLKPPQNARIHSVEVLQGLRNNNAMVICLQRQDGALEWHSYKKDRTPTWQREIDRNAAITQVAPAGWQEDLAEWRFPESGPGLPVLLNTDHMLLGIALPSNNLPGLRHPDMANFDLRPQTYLRKVTAADPLESPAGLLRQVQQNQAEVTTHVEALLAALERPLLGLVSAPRVVAQGEAPAFLGTPSIAQSSLWHRINEQVKREDDIETPIYFTAKQVQPDGADLRQIERNLELLRRMGLIMRVSIEGQPCYRMLHQGEAQYNHTDKMVKGKP